MAKLNLTSVKKENSSPHAPIDVIKWDTALMSGSGRIMISKDNTTSFSEYYDFTYNQIILWTKE